MQKNLSRYWLLLGVSALAIAGLFALVLVFARTPSFAELPLVARLFHEALVVHVDLSVLVWFLAIACQMWSLAASQSPQPFPYIEESALICFALGTLAIALSPIDPHGDALMSNYIPVIHSPIFFLGLLLVLCGVALMLLRLFLANGPIPIFSKALQYGLFSAGAIATVAIAAFVWSFQQMPPEIDGAQYYDLTFWGGGHVLQFVHTQILLICWYLLAKTLKPDFSLSDKSFIFIFSIGLLAAICTPLAYVRYNVISFEHRQFFTHMMIAGNGIAPIALAVVIIPLLIHTRAERKGQMRALWSSLVMSMILFLAGGALGGMIEGQNVVIPAHYHGSIVGVTLAFMGIAYWLLPQFGYRDVSNWKLAYWQPIVYGVGQLMHIAGLAYSGGYGVLRKTPGGMNAVTAGVKAAMGFMGMGGLLAIIGGFLFVIVIAKAVFTRATVV